MKPAKYLVSFFFIDENRDLNGHAEDEIKRQRTQYNGDQLYSNVSILLLYPLLHTK